MGFMKPEKVYGDWYEVEDAGTVWYPIQYFTADELLGQHDKDATVAIRRGQYGVRLSAPGYLDCTEWEVYETEDAADERIREWELEELDADEEDAELATDIGGV
jgi:hypothetical protein